MKTLGQLMVWTGLLVFGNSAFAYIDNFDETTKDMKPIPVSAGQCHVDITDKVSGLNFSSSDLRPLDDSFRPGVRYLSLWDFHLGTNDSNLLATVTPFADQNGKIYLHVIIDVEPGDFKQTGKMEIVELTGYQTSDNQISFHGWSSNKFDYRDNGNQFDTIGSLNKGVFDVSGETDELKYNVSCKF